MDVILLLLHQSARPGFAVVRELVVASSLWLVSLLW